VKGSVSRHRTHARHQLLHSEYALLVYVNQSNSDI
jgi:hypothetical protein